MAPDYNDGFPTCERTHATLRVFSDELEPQTVSRRLGVEATHSFATGDSFGRVGQRRKTNGWFLQTDGRVDSRDLRRHIDWLLDTVDETEVIALREERGASVDVFCYWESKSGHGGPELSPSQMGRIASLGLVLGFDIYFPDRD